jgi:hypothetical protein
VKYVLMFVETEEFTRQVAEMPADERERAFALAGQWFASHADVLSGGAKLQAAHTATTVRRGADGAHLVVDGPFVEGKEVVSGFVEVEADNLDDVLKLVRSWPGCPVVEIRPVELMPLD